MESKVEFLCQHCGSTLRLGSEHQGKQARCPICGVVTLVPFQAGIGAEPLSSAFAKPPVELPSTQPDLPPTPNPYSSPSSFPGPSPAFGKVQSNDGFWWAGLMCGIVSIASNLLFCCCIFGPMSGLLFAFAGGTATIFSQTGPKWINFLLCGIGGAISLAMLVMNLLFV
jgi:DNA-directed RNA polymerase subunit RPC12/RpoP